MSILKKPEAVRKLREFHRQVQANGGRIGTLLRVIEFVYDNACNFRCEHCSTRSAIGDKSAHLMSYEKVGEIADEAHELGVYELNLYGGELLIRPKAVFELLKAVKPERFYTFLTTNGYLMTQDRAYELADAGVDRVSVSIDSLNAEEHDGFRGAKGALERALNALEYVKKAGMQPYMNITVGHFNAMSPELEEMCKYSYDRGYITFMNIAMPVGCWQGKFEVMIDEKDSAHLIELRKKYKNILRDIWNPFDKEYEKSLGCQSISKMYITQNGDVTPCSFIQIKLGNLYEQSLKEIIDYGYSIKYFHDHYETCLAGENRWFAEKFLTGEMSMQHPADAKALFTEDDYIQREEK